MTVNMFRHRYSFCEPFRDKNGEISFAVIPKDTLRLRVIRMSELGKDEDLGLFQKYRMISNSWNLPSDFTKGLLNDGLHKDTTDLRDVFSDVSKRITGLYDRSVFFLDRRDTAINTLFILNTYLKEHLRYAPRLIIEGTTSSGKGRVDSLLTELCYHAIPVGDGSYAASFRMISDYDATPVFSEFGDYGQQERKQLCQMLKIGFDKNGKLFRCASSNFNNEAQIFSVFTPMSLDIKSADLLPEDVINRSFRITMVENFSMKKIDRQYDCAKCEEIRSDLYRLKLLCEIRKIRDRDRPERFNLDRFIADSVKILDDVDEDGFINPSEGSGIRHDTCELTNRTFDIASSYYPLSRLIHCEGDLISKLQSMQMTNRNRLVLTKEALVFNTWVSDTLRYNDRTLEQFIGRALKSSTKDIKDLLCSNLTAEGNLSDEYRGMSTRSVTSALMSIGFSVTYEHMPGHQTYVIETPDIGRLFLLNVKKFCDEDTLQHFISLDFTNGADDEPDTDGMNVLGKTEA